MNELSGRHLTIADIGRRQSSPATVDVHQQQKETAMPNTIDARAIKVTIVVSPAELLAVHCPEGGGPARTVLRLRTPDRTVEVDLASKAIRKAQATIRENGADACVALVQGKLGRGDTVIEAGLVAQIKAKKPEPVAA